MIINPAIIDLIIGIRQQRATAQTLLTLWKSLEEMETLVPEIKEQEDKLLTILQQQDKDALRRLIEAYVPLYRHRKQGAKDPLVEQEFQHLIGRKP